MGVVHTLPRELITGGGGGRGRGSHLIWIPLKLVVPGTNFLTLSPENFVPTQGPACASLNMLAGHSVKAPSTCPRHIKDTFAFLAYYSF